MQLFPLRSRTGNERRYRTPFEGYLPDFIGPDFRFFSSERLGRKILKMGNEELFPHHHKFKDLEVQRCPVSFHASHRGFA
jgi:hypothetical protein